MRRKEFCKTVAQIATVSMLAMSIAGCGGSSEETPTSAPTEAVNEVPTTAPEATTAPSDNPGETTTDPTTDPTNQEGNTEMTEPNKLEEFAAQFNGLRLTKSNKKFSYNNPVMTQRFGADPYALVYDGRVYLYMTADIFEYEATGTIKDNSYGKIREICVISSADLVNWTDHGNVYAAGRDGAATWAGNSWAPAAACKEIDGQMKFFLYFANSGGGIGVLTADSPIGPFTDPLGHALITRDTPNCNNVIWLFDPAVLVDDDGTGYLYFGGGVPQDNPAHPYTARAVQLGDDMISIVGEPVSIDPPYLFEDSGINKFGDTYYYSYCTNWNVDSAGAAEFGIKNAHIAYMTSDSPLGPFTYQGSIMKNPGEFFGCYSNNHHAMFEFNGKTYMTYHTRLLELEMGVDHGYRSTGIDEVTINEDGTIAPITMTKFGPETTAYINPFEPVPAETMQTMAGIDTTQYQTPATWYGTGNMIVTDIESGDWIRVAGVDFADGAKSFSANVRAQKDKQGVMKVCLDSNDAEAIAYVEILSDGTADFHEITVDLLSEVKGSHDLFFVFAGEGMEFDYWYFK